MTVMTVAAFIANLRRQGVELSTHGDRLRCNAPKGVLTPALLKELSGRKTEILAFLHDSDGKLDVNANQVSGAPGTVSPGSLARISRDGELPLSFAQERLWFLHQLEPESAVYNIPFALRLAGRLNVAALRQSINEIVRRHEVFRTTCSTSEGQPAQVISPTLNVPLPVVDLRELPEAQREARMLELATEDAQRPFDLGRGPFLRAALLWLAEEEYMLLLTTHHFVMDGWSTGLFSYELVTLYQAFSVGKPSPLPELPLQYVDYVHWQRQLLQGEALEVQLSYWKQRLGGSLPVLQLPTDRPRPRVQTSRGATQSFKLSKVLTEGLKTLSRRERATLFMTLYAAFQALLHRYTLQDDILVATAVSNRSRIETEAMIGSFVNNLVLRIDLSGNPTFRELLSRVREVALGAYAHQDLPFEKLLEELQPERDLSRTPLFQVMFLLQNTRTSPLELTGLTLTPLEIDSGTAMFDLLLDMVETQEGVQGRLEYNTDLFDTSTIARMLGHFKTLLEGIIANLDQRISDLPLLTQSERQQLLIEWNATWAVFPKDMCFHQLFEAQVERVPEAVAVVCENRQLTYQELNRRANQLGHHLQKLGVGPEVLVALLAERGENFLVTILAVFKAGGAYLPLDPHHPAIRLRQVIEDSCCSLVLATTELGITLSQTLSDMPPDLRPPILYIEDLLQQVQAEENLAVRNTPDHLAYVIYTSGSTGMPKGAMIEHKGMLNHLYAKITALQLTQADIVAQTASQCFDISVWQFLAALLAGGQVHIFKDVVVHDPMQLLTQVEHNKISILETVPSLLRMKLETITSTDAPHHSLADLRWLIPTGEALPPELCRQWLSLYPQIPLLNAYGPTECADDVTHYLIDLPPSEEVMYVPIGRPIQNTQLYILSPTFSPVPIGVAGELYIGGVCVGRGYLKRPELTAAQFISNPFSDEAGARLYKTGDLARYLPDGNIEYLGRIDQQVKLRGFRIELGEIEAVLSQHPAVQQTVMVVRKDTPGGERLVAYVVPQQEEDSLVEKPLAKALRDFLQEQLPDYMLPSDFVPLNALPLTPNGKIDRRALPAPEYSKTKLPETYVAPRDVWELQVVQVWEEILGTQAVGVKDNFFELGGHSLLVMRLISHIQKLFHKTIPVATLFEEPTVEHLANVLRRQTKSVQWSPLVGIQPYGSRRPFFCAHPVGGNVICYADLARHLGLDQPFYGLQARGAGMEEEAEEPLTEIEAMATAYIEALRGIQPGGPYLLGGWSMGGTIAFEMARQLQAQGQQVALLAIIDARAPTELRSSNDIDDAELLASMFNETFPLPVDYLRQLNPDQQLIYVLEQARKANRLPPDIGMSQALRLLRLHKINIQAGQNYVPQAYAGRVTLFRVSEQGAENTSVLELSWRPLAKEGVDVQIVPGDHLTMLRAPHVQVLAERLKACIQRVQIDDPVVFN